MGLSKLYTIMFIAGLVVIAVALSATLYIGLRLLKRDPYDGDDKDEVVQGYYPIIIISLIIGFGLAIGGLMFILRQPQEIVKNNIS